MIDISINKLFTLFTGISIASISAFEMVIPRNNEIERQHENVKATIEEFVKAGDSRDTEKLEVILQSNFRVVANQLMGSPLISTISKDQYLALIREGKLGGDTRQLEIISLEVVHKNASAHVKLKGKTLTFDTFYHLTESSEGNWQLIQDLPFATKN